MKTLILGLAVVASSVGVRAAVPASSSSGHRVQFTLDAHDDFFKAVNTGGAEPQPGDTFVEHWSVTRAGAPVGSMDNQCILLGGDEPAAMCNFVIDIDGQGSLTAVDRVRFHPEGDEMVPDESDAAVTGGTGRYRGTGGQIHIVVTDPDATLAFDLR